MSEDHIQSSASVPATIKRNRLRYKQITNMITAPDNKTLRVVSDIPTSAGIVIAFHPKSNGIIYPF